MTNPNKAHGVITAVVGQKSMSATWSHLVPGGRLAPSVWSSISNCPGFLSLAEALGNHIGPEAAAFMRSPFSLASESELRSLVERAGFHSVKIHPATRRLTFHSPDEFVKRYVAASPFGYHRR